MNTITAEVIRRSRKAATTLPAGVADMARLCLLDWFGLAIAGAREPVCRHLLAVTRAEGAHPVATAVGHGHGFSARQAAFLNAVAGHALDYDDVNLAMHVHPTTVILPPVLALAEARGDGGQALLSAFVAGYEATGMIGAWLGPAPYDRGFHMTGTLGCIGAAAACAHLLGLDEEATARAYGLAASQAAGLKAQFGTMAKPLHAGRAAEAGLCAALWAQAGVSSRTDILEAVQGYAATQAFVPDAPIHWDGYQLERNRFKYHAACFGTHGVFEAIAALRAQGVRPEHVRAVRLKVDAGADRMCNIAVPRNGTEAKFSLRFAAALALAGADSADPRTFDDDATTRPELAALRERITVELAAPGWPPDLTEVESVLTDGRRLLARHDTSIGAANVAALRHKFARLSMGIGADKASGLADLIERIEAQTDLCALLHLAA